MVYMRYGVLVTIASLAWPAGTLAHGPQIQITLQGTTIMTRELLPDGPYSGPSATNLKSVYVMPVAERLGIWYSRPNGDEDPLLPGVPEFYSGPGFAWGWDDPAAAPIGSTFPFKSGFALKFTSGLKKWNGSAFVDAGAAQVEGFSSSATIKTVDGSASGNIQFPGVAGVVADAEAHSTVRYRFLGDGLSTAVAPADGVYLLSLQLKNEPPLNAVGPLNESAPFYYVLSKNGTPGEAAAAAQSLGFDPNLVQFVPEPATGVLLGIGVVGLGVRQRRRIQQAERI